MFRQQTGSRDETILIVTGPIVDEAAEEFGRQVQVIAAGRTSTVTLDLTQCTAMNSQAIGKLLLLRMRLDEQRKVLRIKGCSAQLWSVFNLIKMETLIPIEP